MKAREALRAARFDAALQAHAAQHHQLAGISGSIEREVFVRQLIDSVRRVEYPRRLLERVNNGSPMSIQRTDPADATYFDPIRGAVHHASNNSHDEACWLVFLFVAYGKGKRTGWRLVRDVYGRLGQGGRWDWPTASQDPLAMRRWIESHSAELWPAGTPRPFGAHRQHESVSLSAQAVKTYLDWIGTAGHRRKFVAAQETVGSDPRAVFDWLYHNMSEVYRFGRLARFDYLAMIGKLELALVEPGSTYMSGATGPVKGARLLFANDPNAALDPATLDANLLRLDVDLSVGMQALEDALCNWQKSPRRFKSFRG